jgi:hypothetical protein
MSRNVIAGVVAVVIVMLTAAAFFATSSNVDDRVRKEADQRVRRAQSLLTETAKLNALGLQKDVEKLSTDVRLLRAAKSESANVARDEANLAFQKFTADDEAGPKPDIIALVNAEGDLIAMFGVTTVTKTEWKDSKGEVVWPAINVVLSRRVIISEVWDIPGRGLMRVGIAPIIDVETPVPPSDEDGVIINGAVVLAYSMTSKEAEKLERDLGTDVAFFAGGRVDATSLGGSTKEAQNVLGPLLGKGLADPKTGVMHVTIGGESYLAASTRVPRSSSKPLPATYPPATAGAIVLMSPDDSAFGGIKLFILMVGIGSLVIALIGLYLSHRRMMAQVDSIEVGVADIINGNVDRTFRPVGAEMDGLANGLNVMLSRLLGRPEPGEEELDDDGNPIVPGRVEFEDQAELAPGTDPELARLAQEPEPDYYKRVYTDYKNARQSIGQPDEVSFENFIAKLKVNEGKLRAQYQSKAVRFRVVTKDGKVSLKPVPIL